MIGFLITSSASKATESKVEEGTQNQTAELRKEIMEEAVSALRETECFKGFK